MVIEFPYRWAWRRVPMDRDRRGMFCRVVVRGGRNSALVEFADGYRCVTSRRGLRRGDRRRA